MKNGARGAGHARSAKGAILVGLTALVLLGARARPAQAVTINALIIIGKNDNSGIDRRIPASVRQALTRTFRFNSYSLHGPARGNANWGQSVRFALPGGYALVVKPTRGEGRGRSRRILLQVDIVKGDTRIVGAAVWLKPGRYWLLGGPAVDHGTLIVAMAVTE